MGEWVEFLCGQDCFGIILVIVKGPSFKSVTMKKTIVYNLLLILAYYLFLQLLIAAFVRG